MNHLDKLKRQLERRIIVGLLLVSLVIAVCWFVVIELLGEPWIALIVAGAFSVVLSLVIADLLTKSLLQPVQILWQAILHVSPESGSGQAAPNLEKVRLGRELVTSLALQVYQLASQEVNKDTSERRKEIIQSSTVVSRLPLPLFVFNREILVTNASDSAIEYCGASSSDLFGKPLFDSLNLEFKNEHTLEKWINDCQQNKVTDTAYWERVRVRPIGDEQQVRQCDIAAHYNRDNPSGAEFIVTLFDRTAEYEKDDNAMSFVSLAVHELRTPLTMMRGYIEIFQDELDGKLDKELTGYLHRMNVSASQLTAFVNNILNVSKIEENQLMMHLVEADWNKTLTKILDDLQLRAEIHGMKIERNIVDNLPPVGIDLVSTYEVLGNLIDNAIKYSGSSKRIVVSSALGKDNLVETTVQDFGVGMPPNVVTNLFEKFYRNHRTRGQIGGTGLGLYLSKAIVNAMGGQIWASSKEGQGSTFGFSLVPYTNLAEELKNSNNKEIVRQAHGWVKNHSLLRK